MQRCNCSATANANDPTLAQRLETDPKCSRITRIKLQANWIFFKLAEKNPVVGCSCHKNIPKTPECYTESFELYQPTRAVLISFIVCSLGWRNHL